jgi:RND family efflux transporter MFP subunit
MNDKSDLLHQLKIDRGAGVSRPPLNPRIIGGVIGGLLLVLILYLLLRPSSAIEVHAATAVVPSSGAAAASVLDATGYVVARRQATVSSKVTGKVMELDIEEGQHVKEGQVVAKLDDTNARAALVLADAQLDQARAQRTEARVQISDTERTLKRTKDMTEQGLMSQAALDTAQTAYEAAKARAESAQRAVEVGLRNSALLKQQLDDTVVRAPFAGVITVKNAQPGEMISPLSAGGAGTRTGIGTLVDMESLEIEVDVNENFINRVQPNQPVSATLNAYPDWKIPCNVIAVIPAADRSKATVKVRIGFKEHDPRILPDMGARVNFLSEPAAAGAAPVVSGVRLPADAVLDQDGATVVFVIKDGKVERRAVKAGDKNNAGVQVLSGLSAGEQVASGDLSRLKDGAHVKVIQ